MAALLQTVTPHVRVPRASDRVYCDDCVFSFDCPLPPLDIYTNLHSFLSYGASSLAFDRNGTSVYLHQHHQRKLNPRTAQVGNETPTKLAIGGDGGFAVDERVRMPLDDPDVLLEIKQAAEAVLHHVGNTVSEEVASWQEELKLSKYAEHLEQLSSPPQIASNPLAWKCQDPQCDKQENLWLNLSDGYSGCGRQNWDGSGGCGAALTHFSETGGKYPLAAKLGTITAERGDVYSYAPDEYDMVKNTHLDRHLEHFCINVNYSRKTDKSMNELQVGLNLSHEFDAVVEVGKKLVPVSGAGYIGFKNLGNTLTDRYKKQYRTLEDSSKNVGEDDIRNIDLRPTTFRALVGKGHADFSTGQQQDAVEYLQYLLYFMTRIERVSTTRLGPLSAGGSATSAELPTASLFKLKLEDGVQCIASSKVKYVLRDMVLRLQIPLEAATNATQVTAYQVLEQKR
ncbi:unnamed protein product [Hyaloperonospora brassicae]|uniref:UBP-type domain-containing protein n=1 Tax=Hyaloperonospora brassicae TaxID=162125 RepID=A0AAV0UAP5_HYABA|nr:unnamed protein product [Hyaloperonospora brassicae]